MLEIDCQRCCKMIINVVELKIWLELKGYLKHNSNGSKRLVYLMHCRQGQGPDLSTGPQVEGSTLALALGLTFIAFWNCSLFKSVPHKVVLAMVPTPSRGPDLGSDLGTDLGSDLTLKKHFKTVGPALHGGTDLGSSLGSDFVQNFAFKI